MRRLLYFSACVSLLIACNGEGTDKPGPEGEGCPENEDLFLAEVWEPVLAQNCLVCHSEDGVAEGSRFVLKREGQTNDWLSKNMEVFASLALEDEGGVPIVLLKPTNAHSEGHGGGEVLSAESEAYASLAFYASWVRGDLDVCDEHASGACQEDLPGPRLTRRLTHSAYDNTIMDLLGVESNYGSAFATDNVVNGFFNNAGALEVSGLLAEQYRDAAENLADQAISFRLDTLLECDPIEEGQAYCASMFIRDVGERVFRRRLNTDEVDVYWGLWDTVAQEDGYNEGLKWVLSAMLQSPHFLYRLELGAQVDGGFFDLTDWEIATELSYLLWDTMPDAELFAKAAASALHTPEQIQFEVERMLADPKADRVMEGFVQQWLHLDRLVKVPKIMQVYPDLTFDIRDEMLGETERLASKLMADGGTLEDLFHADHSYMTDALASYYGLPSGTGDQDAEGFRRIDLMESPYGGLLTQGALLTTFARPDSSSPVHRGVMVRERLLCQELPPPPANLEIKPPEMDPEKTTREQYAQHSEDPACADCHERIDPIGFGFEHYDGAGVYREIDGIHEIDDSGEVVKAGSATGTFEGVPELSSLLSQSDEVQSCYVDMWMTYATGLYETTEMHCAAGLITAQAADQSIALSGPLTGLTHLTHFRRRTGDGAEGNGPSTTIELADLADYAAIEDSRYPDLGSGGGGGGGDPEGLELTLTEVSRWGAGYCVDAFVTNGTDSDITWEVSAKLEGTISSLWNANKREAGDETFFTGVSWNSVVAPGGTQSFGFCADI